MINSGTESSRLPQRGASLIRAKLFPLPMAPSTPRSEVWGSFLLQQSCGWAQAAPGAGGDKRERWPHGALGLSPSHPCCKHSRCLLRPLHGPLSFCAPAGGTAHQRPQGRAAGTFPPGPGSHQLLPTRESTQEPCGDARDAPATPSVEFLWPVLPAPTSVQPWGCTCCNSALLAAFVGKGVLKGKSLWGKEIDRGDHFPLFIYASKAACSVPTAFNTPESQLPQGAQPEPRPGCSPLNFLNTVTSSRKSAAAQGKVQSGFPA